MTTWVTEYITPAPHLVGPRAQTPRMCIIHATRGGTANSAIDYSATKNWFRSPNNRVPGTDWGGCASRIIGPLGQHCIVMRDNQMPRYSAGYGAVGPPQDFLLDDYAISYEFAQPDNGVPFTDAQYQRGAKEIAIDCVKFNIPPVSIDTFDQTVRPVPSGITRHDRSGNGRRLGKSDPGDQWDDARFITLLKIEIAKLTGGHQEDDDMARTFVRMQGRVQVYEVVAGRLIWVPDMATVAPEHAIRDYPATNGIWRLVPEFPLGLPKQLGGPNDVGP